MKYYNFRKFKKSMIPSNHQELLKMSMAILNWLLKGVKQLGCRVAA